MQEVRCIFNRIHVCIHTNFGSEAPQQSSRITIVLAIFLTPFFLSNSWCLSLKRNFFLWYLDHWNDMLLVFNNRRPGGFLVGPCTFVHCVTLQSQACSFCRILFPENTKHTIVKQKANHLFHLFVLTNTTSPP